MTAKAQVLTKEPLEVVTASTTASNQFEQSLFQIEVRPYNLKTEAQFNELEVALVRSRWVAGDRLSSDDRKALEKIAYPPNPDTHPHTFAWWSIVSKYSDELKASWKAPACGQA